MVLKTNTEVLKSKRRSPPGGVAADDGIELFWFIVAPQAMLRMNVRIMMITMPVMMMLTMTPILVVLTLDDMS